MTGQKETRKQTNISEVRRKAAARSKHYTQKASNRGVDAFFKDLSKMPGDREYDLFIIVAAKGGGKFEVKSLDGVKLDEKMTLARGLFLPGKLHQRGDMTAAIGAGSHVVVKDGRIEGVLSRDEVLQAKMRMGRSNSSGERVAPEGFKYAVPKRRSRSRSRSRSGSKKRSGSKTRKGKGSSAGSAGKGSGGKNINMYKGADPSND